MFVLSVCVICVCLCQNNDDSDDFFLPTIFYYIFTYSWGHSLLSVIRQQHKQDSQTIEETNEQLDLQLSADQAAHARACAK